MITGDPLVRRIVWRKVWHEYIGEHIRTRVYENVHIRDWLTLSNVRSLVYGSYCVYSVFLIVQMYIVKYATNTYRVSTITIQIIFLVRHYAIFQLHYNHIDFTYNIPQSIFQHWTPFGNTVS